MTPFPRSGMDDDAIVHREVADALAELDRLADQPLAEHVAVFERVHTALGAALAAAAPVNRPRAAEAPGRP
jgi:hypothetical protein